MFSPYATITKHEFLVESCQRLPEVNRLRRAHQRLPEGKPLAVFQKALRSVIR
jgi:hypothetical protein